MSFQQIHKNIRRNRSTCETAARNRRLLQLYPHYKGPVHTEDEWLDKFILLGKACYYCNRSLLIAVAEREHKTPLCRGGSDHIDNIVPACMRCNRMKAWRTEAEFIHDLPRLLTKVTDQRATYKPKGEVAFEEKMNEPGLLKRVIGEREQLSWAWRNPA